MNNSLKCYSGWSCLAHAANRDLLAICRLEPSNKCLWIKETARTEDHRGKDARPQPPPAHGETGGADNLLLRFNTRSATDFKAPKFPYWLEWFSATSPDTRPSSSPKHPPPPRIPPGKTNAPNEMLISSKFEEGRAEEQWCTDACIVQKEQLLQQSYFHAS